MDYYQLEKYERDKLKDYYRVVLRYGIKKHRDRKTLRQKESLLDWMVKKEFTIHMLPDEVYQKIQMEEIGQTMGSIL